MRTSYLYANFFGAGLKSFYSKLFIVLFSTALLASCGGGSDGDAPDDDNDGVINTSDLCANTAAGVTVDTQGCALTQLDDDNDGVTNVLDQCPGTVAGATVDAQGCSSIQLDADQDGVENTTDVCPETPAGESVDQTGCSAAQLDIDGDGVLNTNDLCSNTPAGESVDITGCSDAQLDVDGDGVTDAVDQCPGTAAGATVDAQGCSSIQLDADQDGVENTTDVCPETPAGESVDQTGCSAAQLDIDGDGVLNTNDLCSDTPAGESVDANGCAESQRDTDNDGVTDGNDLCPSTPATEQANLRGCGDVTQSKFTETDGLVVIEMESTNYPAEWALEEGDGSLGDGFIEWTGEDLFNAPGSGLITIPVVITNPGTYRFNWRNSIREGDSSTEANDSWLQIEADNFFGEREAGVIAGDSPVGHIVCPKGQPSSNACVGDAPEGSGSAGWFKVFRFGGTPGDWFWRAGTSDRDTHAIFATFDAAGTYNILVAGRSRAHGIDRLVLYRSGNDSGINITDAAAENAGNVESARQ